MKIYTIKLFSNDSVKVNFYGSKEDMKKNEKSSFIFTVGDYLEGFLIFRLGEDFKDCVPLRFLKQGYRVLVAKN